MIDADLEARLRALPPDLPDPHDRFAQVEGRIRRTRSRQRIGVATVLAAVLAVAVPVALLTGNDDPTRDPDTVIATDPQSPSQSAAQVDHLPGADLDVPLSEPVLTRGTGTTVIELGPRPEGATGVSTDLRCLSAGTFRWPSGASLTCTARDAAEAMDHPESPGNVLDLPPRQTRIVIVADAAATFWISTTYVRTEPTEWGVTATGETYGVPNEAGHPDLIATSTRDGSEVRYARTSDLDAGAGAGNPDEAMAWTRKGALYAVPTYAEDGLTIVGTFDRSGSDVAERATRLVVGSAPAGAARGEVTGTLTVTGEGCLHIETSTGPRWLILPWGVQLADSSEGGALERFTGEQVADLGREVTFTGSELPGQEVEAACGTGLPPFYVTWP